MDALHTIAKRLVWWKTPEEALAQKNLFLAQVMAFGTWNDIQVIREAYGDAILRETLGRPPPGIFDPRSWHYWHGVFHIQPVPPLPQRKFE